MTTHSHRGTISIWSQGLGGKTLAMAAEVRQARVKYGFLPVYSPVSNNCFQPCQPRDVMGGAVAKHIPLRGRGRGTPRYKRQRTVWGRETARHQPALSRCECWMCCRSTRCQVLQLRAVIIPLGVQAQGLNGGDLLMALLYRIPSLLCIISAFNKHSLDFHLTRFLFFPLLCPAPLCGEVIARVWDGG